jgi:pyruvate/2-oxoglutarate dehydrogenase complex dihydrolipoamide acyltransferase (E2) component
MFVKVTDKADPTRVVISEQHPQHPNGEVFIKGDSEAVHEVERTGAVLALVRAGILERVSAPTAENDDTEAPPAVDATDSAIALANELGIDLTEVAGTGQDGRILKSDVLKANSN